jgi:hypothetical protein
MSLLNEFRSSGLRDRRCHVSACFCSVSPASIFRNLSRESVAGETVLLQDVFIVEGTATDTGKFDAVWNLRMSDSLLYFLNHECRKRNYSLSRALLASMGMPFGGKKVYSLVSTEEERESDIDDLPKKNPPFCIDTEIDSSEEAKHEWKNICRSLLQTPFHPEATHTIIAEASEFGKRLNASTLFVCFATGIIVPAGERAREVHMHPNKPPGYVSDEKTSQASITLYVIDVESGELLWADQNVLTGGNIYVGKMYILLERVLDRLH